MAPPFLLLRDCALTFGGTPLLTGANLQVMPQDRICLVGRNGSGKSTFLKIAAGQLEMDDGERFVQPGLSIAYLSQEPDLSGFETVGDFAASGLSNPDEAYRAERLLDDLAMSPKTPTHSLSGGEARRAAIAMTLAPEPDVILLDEPTNHLDMPAIEWLETELAAIRSAIVLISHDRAFLSALSRTTVWLDRGKTQVLNAGFDQFESWRDELLEQEAEAAHKLDRKIAREEKLDARRRQRAAQT